MSGKKIAPENPALSYLGERTGAAVHAVSRGRAETRSRRVQCLLRPSLYEKIRKMADDRGASVNDLMHEALERFAESESGK
jgi:hypothetical protein